MPLRILIGDAHSWSRATIRRLLEGKASVVGEAETAEEAVRLTAEQRPDVVLLDIDFSGVDHMRLSRRIRAAWPWTKVILLTSHSEESYLKSTGKSGVDAFLPKVSLRTGLVPAVRSVAGHSGRPWDGRERRRPARHWAPRRHIGPERRGSHGGPERPGSRGRDA